ncbi:hypothetical protein MYX82_13280 [Acidobacteria bacterium AH-259-D05]|nr:hypothetical protein [Acidobacteria bacterium AH-259-D05]
MGKYIRMTKTYLILVTVFVLLRFILELAGVNENVTSEISLTRLLLVLPIFLGLRFSRESLGGWKEMLIANLVYVIWGIGLVMVAVVADKTMELGTQYSGGSTLFNYLFWGRFLEFHAWSRLMRGAFCTSMLIMAILTNVLCFVTVKLNGGARH